MCIVGIGVIGGLVYSNKKQIMAVSPPEKKRTSHLNIMES